MGWLLLPLSDLVMLQHWVKVSQGLGSVGKAEPPFPCGLPPKLLSVVASSTREARLERGGSLHTVPLTASCLLMSHWPVQVTFESPASEVKKQTLPLDGRNKQIHIVKRKRDGQRGGSSGAILCQTTKYYLCYFPL